VATTSGCRRRRRSRTTQGGRGQRCGRGSGGDTTCERRLLELAEVLVARNQRRLATMSKFMRSVIRCWRTSLKRAPATATYVPLHLARFSKLWSLYDSQQYAQSWLAAWASQSLQVSVRCRRRCRLVVVIALVVVLIARLEQLPVAHPPLRVRPVRNNKQASGRVSERFLIPFWSSQIVVRSCPLGFSSHSCIACSNEIKCSMCNLMLAGSFLERNSS
jgi:hypothetical protein